MVYLTEIRRKDDYSMGDIFTGRNKVGAKVMFLQASVILGEGVSASVHVGIPHPPRGRHPPGSIHPLRNRHPSKQPPPGADTPRSGPPKQTPPKRQTSPKKQIPLGSRHPPSRHPPPKKNAGSGIRSMSGRYASYWNAFLLILYLVETRRDGDYSTGFVLFASQTNSVSVRFTSDGSVRRSGFTLNVRSVPCGKYRVHR